KTRWGKPEEELLGETVDTEIRTSNDNYARPGNDSDKESETGENEVKND
ncbi:MAG TPA: hypothetical protein G4O15_12350, partial [Dehalococcoidia bacterium]|nr:hypothetical protein [Dehalococcoidia bacterium]